MGRVSRALVAVMFMAVALAALAYAADPEIEIDYLLTAVGNSGCTFIRNGKSHSAEDAEAHLRMKYKRGKKYADTAEHFIERLATASSWTKKVYTLSCGGEEATATGDWLSAKLEAYRAAYSPVGATP